MRSVRWLAALSTVIFVFGCAAPTVTPPSEEDDPIMMASSPTPLIEYPPIEPVEPPIPAEGSPREPELVPPAEPSVTRPPSLDIVPLPSVTVDEQEVLVLLADLQRYNTLGPEDQKRELQTATQALSKQRSDANRVRLAVLFTLAKSSPQDDLRAQQLLDNVTKSNPGSAAVKQLAAVLQAQIADRVRAVRDEQVKTDAAVQKLDALRKMERSLLRDRISGGGGGGSGSGGGSGGGGGGGGGSGGR